jgi:hypothetical protein
MFLLNEKKFNQQIIKSKFLLIKYHNHYQQQQQEVVEENLKDKQEYKQQQQQQQKQSQSEEQTLNNHVVCTKPFLFEDFENFSSAFLLYVLPFSECQQSFTEITQRLCHI